jgi:hypothetical protein
MLREVILFIKYPYTAGVIATIWLGTAVLLAINQDLPGIRMVTLDVIISVVIASIGFTGKKEI